MPMHRRFAALAALSALALALSASPAFAGSPAEHYSLDAVGITFDCGTTNYSVTSGTFEIVTRTATSSSGNWIQSGTVTARNVVALAAGKGYRVVGVEHYNETFNARTGVVVAVIDGNPVSQAVTTVKFQLISSQGGGTADSVDLVQHVSPNGHYNEFVPGSCSSVG